MWEGSENKLLIQDTAGAAFQSWEHIETLINSKLLGFKLVRLNFCLKTTIEKCMKATGKNLILASK